MSSSSNEDSGRLFALSGLAGLLGLVALVAWWPGCRQYPAVTSPESLSLIKLVYAACNTQELPRLEMAEKRLDEALRAGKVSAAEERAFRKIIELGKRGDWEQGQAAAFKFAQDQIGQGSSKTRGGHDHDHHDHTHAHP